MIGRAVAGTVIAAALAQGCAPQADKSDERSAWRAYRQAHWAEAEAALGGLRRDWAAQMAAGVSAYRQRRFVRAVRYFRHAAWWAETPEKRAAALLNLGNALFRLQRYAPAVETFEQALLYWPGWEDARRDLALARNALAYMQARRQLRQRNLERERSLDVVQNGEEKMKLSRGRHRPNAGAALSSSRGGRSPVEEKGATAFGGQTTASSVLEALKRAAEMDAMERMREAEKLQLKLRRLDRRLWQVQRRLFEREEGYEAEQKTPHARKGVLPW